jgi:hypothetical protein
MDERSSEDWSGVIAGLKADRIRAEAELAELVQQRRPHALGVATGNVAAVAAVDRLGKAEAKLRTRLAVLGDALVDAAAQRDAAAAAEARAAVRRAQAAQIGHELLQAAGDVDAAALQLGRVLRRHAELVDALRRLGVDSSVHGKLRNRTMTAGALHLAGLAGHLPLSPRAFARTVHGWNERLLGHVLAAAPAEAAA